MLGNNHVKWLTELHKQNKTNEVIMTDFNTFLMNNQEKYQGVTREQFDTFYTQAKVQAKRIAEVIGLPVDTIDNDTSDVRLSAMIADGDVLELNGLLWRKDAIDDARLEYEGIDSDSEQKDEENEDAEF